MSPHRKPRVLVFIVAYNAEKTISHVVKRIPASLREQYDVEILIIDDASRDSTFERSHQISSEEATPFKVTALFNPVNQGYGGNQKLGYHYALENDYDIVVLLHGDGQYAPECLPVLLEPLRSGEADAVFGSRMMTRLGALRGGMPLYKYIGNKILTKVENVLLEASLTEFHSGYRLYSVEALSRIPFERNSNDFHFDTEIIIQLLISRARIKELEIPTYYGDEICHVNGLKYAKNVIVAALQARLQKASLFYDPKYDCAPGSASSHYTMKLDYMSPHTLTLDRVRRGSRVIDVGCAGGYMGSVLKRSKDCHVVGVDAVPVSVAELDEFYVHDLDDGVPRVCSEATFDYVLLLDVIEHLRRPDSFLEELRLALGIRPGTEVIVSTGNIAFGVTRMMLTLGQFNYGKRGILDLTHCRLYTFASLRRGLEQAGFTVEETVGVPAPFPLALGDNAVSRFLVAVNRFLIRILPGLFSYQIFMRAKARPSLEFLLADAHQQSAIRAEELERARS
jgi:glycosyltransferase involved in cell wall biosynthesis